MTIKFPGGPAGDVIVGLLCAAAAVGALAATVGLAIALPVLFWPLIAFPWAAYAYDTGSRAWRWYRKERALWDAILRKLDEDETERPS